MNLPAHRSHGVTLIELMVAVAVVGILALIAVPTYQSYRLKAGRSVGVSCLLEAQQRVESHYSKNMELPASLSVVGLSNECGDAPRYQRSLTAGASSPCAAKSTPGHYALRASSMDAQTRDGALVLCVSPSIANPDGHMGRFHFPPGSDSSLLPGWDFKPGQ